MAELPDSASSLGQRTLGIERTEPEPCYRCACCELWAAALQLLRDHTARHVAGELRLAPCDPECLLCAEIDWQGPAVPDDEARAEMRRRLLAGEELEVPRG